MIEMTVEEALEELTQANFHSEERALRKHIEALEECLDGCLHFDDGFVRSDVLGNALAGWRDRARQLLNKEI